MGTYKDGAKDGIGFLFQDEKPCYLGEFQKGKQHGIGLSFSADGNFYFGNFKEGLLTGKVIAMLQDNQGGPGMYKIIEHSGE